MGHKPKRNAPCPCGSALKYKHHCGKSRPSRYAGYERMDEYPDDAALAATDNLPGDRTIAQDITDTEETE